MFWQEDFWQDHFWEDHFWEGLVFGSGAEYYGKQINDAVYAALGNFDGTNNDKVFAYLRGLGYNGTNNDMLFAYGGMKKLLVDLKILKQ